MDDLAHVGHNSIVCYISTAIYVLLFEDYLTGTKIGTRSLSRGAHLGHNLLFSIILFHIHY